jgi:hypothetical protein
MSLNPHSRTRATVVRAGYRTTLVSLSDWYGGQILAPVDTWILMVATSRIRDFVSNEGGSLAADEQIRDPVDNGYVQ